MVWWRGLLATVIAAENGQFAHIERPALPFRLLDGIVHELLKVAIVLLCLKLNFCIKFGDERIVCTETFAKRAEHRIFFAKQSINLGDRQQIYSGRVVLPVYFVLRQRSI
jgi:hypothetical protein